MIRKLPPHIVHQIAAGEVVERPASALKELIENALDAQAKKISIEYSEGGLHRLQIDDDGHGISASELPLAFEAHATSKLRDFDDFMTLKSYGFRGEALSALGSVSDLQIWTSTADETLGSLGRVNYGVSDAVKPTDKRLGTQVLVTDLFARHPARLKFMKSVRSETQALQQVFRRYALAMPEMAWAILDQQSQKEIRLSPSSRLDRTLWFFDGEDSEQWFSANGEEDLIHVEVLALKPKHFGKVRSGLQFFLNGRPIRDSSLEFSLRRAYEGFTLEPRSLAAVVYIQAPPSIFDVNVHPMKSEVRFLNADKIFSLIVRTVRDSLQSLHLEGVFEPVLSRSFAIDSPPRVEAATDLSRAVTVAEQLVQPMPVARSLENSSLPHHQSREGLQLGLIPDLVSKFKFLGSLDHTYIVAERDQALYLFDQHALHERVLYEELLQFYKDQKSIPSQRLLFPIPVLLQNAEKLVEHEEVLESLGFEMRLWNDGKVQIVAAPAILKRGYDLVLHKLAECRELPIETLTREVLSTVACHSAVRAHDRVCDAEVERLLKSFSSQDALGHCPHGRPTFIRFEVRDLEKQFQRVV